MYFTWSFATIQFQSLPAPRRSCRRKKDYPQATRSPRWWASSRPPNPWGVPYRTASVVKSFRSSVQGYSTLSAPVKGPREFCAPLGFADPADLASRRGHYIRLAQCTFWSHHPELHASDVSESIVAQFGDASRDPEYFFGVFLAREARPDVASLAGLEDLLLTRRDFVDKLLSSSMVSPSSRTAPPI